MFNPFRKEYVPNMVCSKCGRKKMWYKPYEINTSIPPSYWCECDFCGNRQLYRENILSENCKIRH